MVLPVHDVNPLRRRPVVTWLLIAVNVVVFVVLEPVVNSIGGVSKTSVSAACSQESYFDRWGAIPKELIDNKQLPLAPTGDPGPNTGGHATCSIERPAYTKIPALSVLTAMFLHGSWLHLLGNMLFLYVFGNNVEDRLGHVGYIAFYLAAGYVAAYGFALVFRNSQTALIGASGAIAGVLGAYLVFWPRARIWSLVTFLLFFPLRLPAWLVLGSWFLLQWWYSVGGLTTQGTSGQASGVAYLAHVIGFVFGAVVGLALHNVGSRRRGMRGYPPPEWQNWRRPYR